MDSEDKLGQLFQIPVTTKLREELRGTAVWAKLSAILSIAVGSVSFVKNMVGNQVAQAIIVAIVTAVLAVFMFNFGNNAKRGIDESDQDYFESSLDSLRLYFKSYVIVITITVVLLAAVFFFSSLR